ncbi:glycerol-3-phosphate 1-O-acyltransferase PlsY [Kaustia mangrovi]|uniref:Glycerol-3-phosphate acyltransferase n=1 Tax=Kaustia mangrovi TaxID=2593653 RepID=A0A7S8HAN2_9HYPH|nr:glycerol-3-phosphate 1-O-acyltransferase PlsY [Kaustia mangrovi]QPC41609.1 glycerol-3-phosphate 1-O-acyltransferase PlsY [Kaustia mangrovi]
MPGEWPLPLTATLVALAFGYLCGSIPFGLIFARLFRLGDLRQMGSGNIGATNVLRTGSKPVAAATLLCDVLKGVVPVLVASQWHEAAGIVAGLGAFLGHIFPVWLRFRGGKGVATLIGVFLGLAWPLALAFLAIWLLVAVATRYSSLSALVASTLTALGAVVFHGGWLAVAVVAMAVIVFFTHRANIVRLARGEETRISLGR